MLESDTLARVRLAHQASQRYPDQDASTSSEEGELLEGGNTCSPHALPISTEPIHPETFHRTGDGGFSIGAHPVTRIEPTSDTTLFTCYTEQPDGTTQRSEER